MPGPKLQGRFVWHELLTTDVAAARRFYPEFMRWTSEPWSTDSAYTLWMARSGPVAGLMALPDEATAMGAPPNWLTYIGAPDVDATARRATTLGARVLKEPDTVQGAGRFAILADPQGAVFGITNPDTPAIASSPPKHGEFSWHELATTDPMDAFTFYSTLFGWQKAGEFDMGPEGVYQMYGWDSSPRGGIYLKPAGLPAPSYWLPYAVVPSADRAASQAVAAGGSVVNGPMEVPGGDRIAVITDPQGALFAVHAKAPVKTIPAKSRAAKRAPRRKTARKKALKKTLKTRRGRVAKKKPARKRPARRPRRQKRKPSRRPPRKPR